MVEEQVREAILAELERQSEARPGKLKLEQREETAVIEGEVQLDELVMAILGAVAGGP
jgi:hypothetical protein